MDRFDCRKVTVNCFQLALNDLTQALYLFEHEQYALSEKKMADVIYKATSALQLINFVKEPNDYIYKNITDT